MKTILLIFLLFGNPAQYENPEEVESDDPPEACMWVLPVMFLGIGFGYIYYNQIKTK